MASWSFNSGGLDNRAALIPRNHDPAGGDSTMPELAKTGNTLRVDVQPARVVRSQFSPPSGRFTGVRTSGDPTRIIVWRWRVCAIGRAELFTVRYKIERYFDKFNPSDTANPLLPGAYTLSDGTRSALAVLLPRGTGSHGRILPASGGRFIEDWTLTFLIGRSLLTVTAF